MMPPWSWLNKFLRQLKACAYTFIAWIVPPSREPKNLVMIGSNYGDTPDKNVTTLLDFLQHSEEYEICFVSERPYPDVEYLMRGNLKSYLHARRATAILYSHSLSDVLPWGHKIPTTRTLLKQSKLIFLQHGVIGFKATLANGKTMQDYVLSLRRTMDIICVSSMAEKEIVASFGVEPKIIHVTGLPRFDLYSPLSNAQKYILVGFTWQSEADHLSKSSQVKSALANTPITNHEIRFLSHPMMHKKSDGSKPPQLPVEQIKNCALLITDDSSLAWDVYLNEGEVIFYKPSLDWLIDTQLLESRRCTTEPSLRLLLNQWLQGSLEPLPQSFVKLQHTNCTQKVVSLIKKSR